MKGKTYIVTRHSGAVAWLKAKGIEGDVITPEYPQDQIKAGDKVFGVLPLHLIDDVLRKGGEFFSLQLPAIPLEMRGEELSAEQMEELGGVKVVKVKTLTMEEVKL